MRLRFSKYNLLIEENNCFYIYNLISGCIFKISFPLYEFFCKLKAKDKAISASLFKEDLLSYLLENKILYDESEDELQSLMFHYNRDKFDSSFLSLVMLPTLKCNLNCHYCYEKEKTLSLTDKDMMKLKLFFSKQAALKKFITVRWSGGECLLIWNKIRELSNYIINECNNNRCTYSASVITNGTLLTSEIVEEMLECNVRSLQITLDGAKEIHDSIRFEKSGKGSFNDVIKGIEIASKKMKVFVRINVDKNNFSSMEQLFQTIAKSKINTKNIQLFCKPVLCTLARTPQTNLFSHKEFYEVEKALLKLAEIYELPYAFHWGIKGKNVRCAYNCFEGHYVTPNLNLYKCPIYVDYTGNNSVGYISNKGDIVIQNYEEYNKGLSYSPFKLEECRECKVLPICHGKCPVIWELSNCADEEGCIPDKFSIVEKIKYALKSEKQMLTLKNSGIL